MGKYLLRNYNPVRCVFLRMLAWQQEKEMAEFNISGLTHHYLQLVRKQLGLSELSKGSGASYNFLEEPRKSGDLIEKGRKQKKPGLYLKVNPKFTNWRFLYLPLHSVVRQLSSTVFITKDGACSANKPRNYTHLIVALRNPELPRLNIYIGKNKPKSTDLNKARGVYFIREQKGLYIGKTLEFNTRTYDQFKKRKAVWWIFITPGKDNDLLSQDAIGAAEALLISFWNEVCKLTNRNCGLDTEPHFCYLQHGVILMQAASAVLMYLMSAKGRKEVENMLKDIGIKTHWWAMPFKKIGAQSSAKWPECYFDPMLR
jgi:hypothetical protein